MYWNKEHYPDPTAGMAIANIMREERLKKKGLLVSQPLQVADNHSASNNRRKTNGNKTHLQRKG